MGWVETGDLLHPWVWVRDEPPTEALPVVLPKRVPGATELPPRPDPVLTQPTPLPHLPADSAPAVTSQNYDNVGAPAPVEETPVNLRREPAVTWMSLVAPTVAALSAFLFVSDPDTQAVVNAAAVAIAGAITAWLVRADNLLPALTGAAQAIVALLVGLGLDWTPEQQASLLVPVGIIAGIVVRDRVVAPVPAVDSSTRLVG